MMPEEAIWIGNELRKILAVKDKVTVLNIGSSTQDVWAKEQPYIGEQIYNVITNSGGQIYNADIKETNDIDFVGDLNDEQFIHQLTQKKFDVILCSNVLEHVAFPRDLCSSIKKIMRKSTYVIITVPYLYPYHPDPEDYLFRPSTKDLQELFKELKCIISENVIGRRVRFNNGIIQTDKNYASMLCHDFRLFITTIVRFLVPFYRFKNWKRTAYFFPKMFKPFSVSCAVFQMI